MAVLMSGGVPASNDSEPLVKRRSRMNVNLEYPLDARAERGDEACDDGRERQVDLRKVADRSPAFQEIRIGGGHWPAAGLQLVVRGVRPRPDVEDRQLARDVADRLADVADDRDWMPRRDQPRILRRSVAQ